VTECRVVPTFCTTEDTTCPVVLTLAPAGRRRTEGPGGRCVGRGQDGSRQRNFVGQDPQHPDPGAARGLVGVPEEPQRRAGKRPSCAAPAAPLAEWEWVNCGKRAVAYGWRGSAWEANRASRTGRGLSAGSPRFFARWQGASTPAGRSEGPRGAPRACWPTEPHRRKRVFRGRNPAACHRIATAPRRPDSECFPAWALKRASPGIRIGGK